MSARRMHEDEVEIDVDLVRALVDGQFPHWAGLALELVEPWGTANAIWRLGDHLVVRLPRIHWAVDQVAREATWLPVLAGHLPVAVPRPVAIGEPAAGYPYRWAVHEWLFGTPAETTPGLDPMALADGLAQVVRGLARVPTHGAPPARRRAHHLEYYDAATRRAIEAAAAHIDVDAATAVWDDALAAAPHDGPPVWVHGDLEGNCLVEGGRLSGLVDWGSACAGDPAVDVQVVWSPLFTAASRQQFLDELTIDEDTLRRSRGAAVNQACAALPYYLDSYPLIVARARHKLRALGIPVSPSSG